MKWSLPHNKKRYLAFLLPLLSLFGVVTLGFSYWFLDFLPFPFPLILFLGVWIDLMAFTLVETVGEEGAVVEVLCCLEGLTADKGWIEPTTPLTGFSMGGLVGSMLG